MASSGSRVVAHFDLDSFFVQVERMRRPHLRDKPIAVYQHSDIICVSYEARKLGLRKHDHPQHAANAFPSVVLVSIAKEEGTSKVSYKTYADTSDAVLAILRRYSERVEKASIDEAFIEFSPSILHRDAKASTTTIAAIGTQTHGAGDELGTQGASPIDLSQAAAWDGQVLDGHGIGEPSILLPSEVLFKRAAATCHVCCVSRRMSSFYLSLFSWIERSRARCMRWNAQQIRQAIKFELGLTVSIGIAGNKLLAKLMSRRFKPDHLTTLLNRAIPSTLLTLLHTHGASIIAATTSVH